VGTCAYSYFGLARVGTCAYFYLGLARVGTCAYSYLGLARVGTCALISPLVGITVMSRRGSASSGTMAIASSKSRSNSVKDKKDSAPSPRQNSVRHAAKRCAMRIMAFAVSCVQLGTTLRASRWIQPCMNQSGKKAEPHQARAYTFTAPNHAVT
jgi:hypothetical protein